MSCLGECWDLGPPPNSILFMPPPPAPSFLQHRLRDNATSIPCAAANQFCTGTTQNGIEWEPPRGDFVELSRQDVGTADDTWPLVLIAATVGVLVLGALLALFLLRCREQHGLKEHQHQSNRKSVAASTVATTSTLPMNEPSDARAVCWAALTPRGGTQHFLTMDSEENHHYESVDGPWYRPASANYDYEEPVLLSSPTPAWLQQQDMRCISTLRRPRPRVSPPQRIEHPNLPPLNLNPLVAPPPPPPPRRPPMVGTLSRRPSDTSTILKYNIN